MSTTMTDPKLQNKENQNQETRMSNVSRSAELQRQMTFVPRFDIWEADEELILYGDLPGVEPDGLDIHFENRRLTIQGTVCRRCEDGVSCVYSEYGVGDFQRSFMIGETIDSEAISAELHNGVLTLHLPKSEAAKPRKIEVKAD